MDGTYTPRQGQYLAFIYHYTKVHGRPPAQADMQQYFRVSPPTVHQMILNLEKRGLLARVPGEPRSLRVLLPPEQLPTLGSPAASREEQRADKDTQDRPSQGNRKRAATVSDACTAMARLKGEEKVTLLRTLLRKHPELAEEVEALAASVIGDVSTEDIAQDVEDAVRCLDLDDLNSRAGSHADGYVEPSEAAWELVEDAVMPFIEDITRRVEGGQREPAIATCAGVVRGLRRLHDTEGGEVLGWTPDSPGEMAGDAVRALRKALRKLDMPGDAGAPTSALPNSLREAAPEWTDVLERSWGLPD
jgi:repressor LexA